MSPFKIFAAVALLGFSSASFATQSAFICNACSVTEVHREALDWGNGDLYYFDMIARKVTHLRVSGVGNNRISSQITATPLAGPTIATIAITAAEQSEFNATQAIYDVNGSLNVGGKSQVSIQLVVKAAVVHESAVFNFAPQPNSNSNGTMNAFDIINTPANQNAAINKATDPSTFGGFIESQRVILSNFVNNAAVIQKIMPNPTTIISQIVFPDGSLFLMSYDYNLRNFAYLPGSAKDSYGNSIPDNAIAAAGGVNSTRNYPYPGSADGVLVGTEMLGTLRGVGAVVGAVDIHGDFVIACVNAGGVTTCTVGIRTN